MGDPFAAAIRAHVAAASERDSVSATDLSAEFIATNPDLVAAHSQKLVLAAVRRMITALGREEDGQLELLPGLPRMITVGPDQYVPRGKATLDDLRACLAIREGHARDAEKRVEALAYDIDRLTPIMDGHPDMTVDEAVPLLSEEG